MWSSQEMSRSVMSSSRGPIVPISSSRCSRPPRTPVGVDCVSDAPPPPDVVGTDERCRLPRMSQPEKATTVTIIGAGLGGIALVANLGLLGYRLRLHDRDEARIARVRER